MLEIDLNIENKSLFTLSEAFTYTISNQKPSSQRKHTFYTNPIHKFKLNPFHFIQNNSMVNLSCYEHETKSQNLICIITSRLLRKHNNLYQKRLETGVFASQKSGVAFPLTKEITIRRLNSSM